MAQSLASCHMLLCIFEQCFQTNNKPLRIVSTLLSLIILIFVCQIFILANTSHFCPNHHLILTALKHHRILWLFSLSFYNYGYDYDYCLLLWFPKHSVRMKTVIWNKYIHICIYIMFWEKACFLRFWEVFVLLSICSALRQPLWEAPFFLAEQDIPQESEWIILTFSVFKNNWICISVFP